MKNLAAIILLAVGAILMGYGNFGAVGQSPNIAAILQSVGTGPSGAVGGPRLPIQSLLPAACVARTGY